MQIPDSFIFSHQSVLVLLAFYYIQENPFVGGAPLDGPIRCCHDSPRGRGKP